MGAKPRDPSLLHEWERKQSKKTDPKRPPLPDQSRPREDSWYIRMIAKRLRWEGCEDRDTVIRLFMALWPELGNSNKVGEFYAQAATLLEAEKTG